MDRSSMRVVQTNDHETRQAFKARLASKLETSEQNQEPAISPDPFQVGATVWHPNLGEATILTVGHDLVLKFSHGEKVFNQEQIKPYLSFTAPKAETPIRDEAAFGDVIERLYPNRPDVVHRPMVEQPIRDFDPVPEVTFVPEKESKRDEWQGAFFGEEIDRTPPNRSDQALRQPQNTGKMVSPDFQDSNVQTFRVGTFVWHPQLGQCLVESVDKSKNEIILLATDGQKVELVLSQVQSKLHAVAGQAPEVVPVKPLVREQSRNLQTRNELKKISVNLPNQFKDWTKQNQFLFLTQNQHLTTDDANRVFTALGRPDDASVSVKWFEPEPLPVPEVREVVVYKTINGSELRGRKVWHPDFGACTVSYVDNNEIVLDTNVGNIPFVASQILPILVPLSDDTQIEHTPVKLGPSVPVPSFAKEEQQIRFLLSLPKVFNDWKTAEQYQYLTGNKHLTPEDANNILLSGGKAGKFDIEWTDEHPEAAKVAEADERLHEKFIAVDKPPIIDAKVLVEPGVKRVVEEVEVVKKEVVAIKLSLELPEVFKIWKTSDQFTYLSKTKQLSPDEAHDAMAVIGGSKPSDNKLQFEITWSE